MLAGGTELVNRRTIQSPTFGTRSTIQLQDEQEARERVMQKHQSRRPTRKINTRTNYTEESSRRPKRLTGPRTTDATGPLYLSIELHCQRTRNRAREQDIRIQFNDFLSTEGMVWVGE